MTCTSGERKSQLANKSSDDTSEHRIESLKVRESNIYGSITRPVNYQNKIAKL